MGALPPRLLGLVLRVDNVNVSRRSAFNAVDHGNVHGRGRRSEKWMAQLFLALGNAVFAPNKRGPSTDRRRRHHRKQYLTYIEASL